MNTAKSKIPWYILLAGMSILTVLFFFDIKFVAAGLNIILWDILAAVLWVFVKLCQWAGRRNTEGRILVVLGVTLLGALAGAILFLGAAMGGLLPSYVEQTEPQTRRTFAAEYSHNLMMRGSVKLYERFGPFLLACDTEEYVGEFSLERPEDRYIYVSGDSIVVAYFFLRPTFVIPLE